MLTLPFPLTRPLVALDVETHAKLAPEQSFIIELGFIMVYPDEREPKCWRHFINPRVPISVAATEIHGITDEDVKLAPSFKELAQNLAKGFTACDFAGYNVRFDLRVLAAEMRRHQVEWSYDQARLLDGLRLWQIAKPRTLTDAVKEILEREPRQAHRALEDAEDALDVIVGALKKFPHLPLDIQKLHDLSFPRDPNWVDADGKLIWIDGQVCFNFGKHKGTPLRKLSSNYLEWVIKADFPPEIKAIMRGALKGQYPQRQEVTHGREAEPLDV